MARDYNLGCGMGWAYYIGWDGIIWDGVVWEGMGIQPGMWDGMDLYGMGLDGMRWLRSYKIRLRCGMWSSMGDGMFRTAVLVWDGAGCEMVATVRVAIRGRTFEPAPFSLTGILRLRAVLQLKSFSSHISELFFSSRADHLRSYSSAQKLLHIL